MLCIREVMHSSLALFTFYPGSSKSKFCRDKIQERFVELLALSAGGASPERLTEVDESVCCGVPGKVGDAEIVHNILKVPPDAHVFFAPSK